VTNPNYVIVLSGKLTEKIDVSSGIKDNGLILINSEKDSSYFSFIKEKCRVLAFDVNSISLRYKLGSAYMPMVNVPILGVFARITDLLQLDSLIKALPRFITVSLKKNEDALIESYNQASLICA
jgi:Pyruvate/2-oxoacid:ferredoxin oxidoreductase gamma subunit